MRQRAERLISRGVVQVVGVTDPLAMGFQQPAFIGLHVDAARLDEIAERIAELEEVTYVVVTAGRFDMICEVVCADNEHLLRVLTEQLAADRRRPRHRDDGRAALRQGKLSLGHEVDECDRRRQRGRSRRVRMIGEREEARLPRPHAAQRGAPRARQAGAAARASPARSSPTTRIRCS